MQPKALMTDTSWQLPQITAGNLLVKLAATEREVEQAQALRYSVFVDEMGAQVPEEAYALKRDIDEFDPICDHLLVMDMAREDEGENPVVGTYRLLRSSIARQHNTFYTQDEFDISAILASGGESLELGRSCVHQDYRTRATMQLLWRGIGAYIMRYDIEWMFGCASFNGTEVEPIKKQLSYLYHHHLAPPECRTKAQPDRYIGMNLVPKEETEHPRVVASLPPLIKGYLRLGGYVGDGAVLDPAFNTIDVCIIVKTESVTEQYLNRYAWGGSEHAE